jgi:hypothetical protein
MKSEGGVKQKATSGTEKWCVRVSSVTVKKMRRISCKRDRKGDGERIQPHVWSIL